MSGVAEERAEERVGEPEIVDGHCHIASFEHWPRSFVEGSVDNLLAQLEARGLAVDRRRLWALYEGKLRDPLCDELVAEMGRAGIRKSVLLAADFTVALADCPLTIEEIFERHRVAMARHPGRLEVFGGVDPRWGRDGVALFERSLTEFGFSGFKVYPPCGFSPSSRELFPFYELCAHHRVPVLIHIGPTSPVLAFDTAVPWLVDEAARQFPTVPFILAHGSVSYPRECAMMCRFRPNVYLDISAFQLTVGWDPPGGALGELLGQGLHHKILFGTDWPVFRMQGDQASCVEFLTAEGGLLAESGEAERALVLGGNIERLLACRRRSTDEPVAVPAGRARR